MDPLPPATGAENGESPAPKAQILPHQQNVFEQLLELTQIATCTQHGCFPIRPRTSTLVIGPSGSGKTFMPKALQECLGLPLCLVAISDWILLGCASRGASVTWPAIAGFLAKHYTAPGVIIAIDEIDKLSRRTSWEVFITAEVFALLDLRIPDNLRDRDDDSSMSETLLEKAKEVLSSRTMIIGMGAFQDIWEERQAPTIGFQTEDTDSEMPGLRSLAEIVPPELANRFRSQILVLPPLTVGDYHAMLDKCAQGIPGNFRLRFLAMGRAAIPEAFTNRKGPRFLEELLVDVLIAERREIRAPLPPITTTEDQLTI